MSIENSVTLVGNLGGDPEVKFTQGGVAVAKVSMATTSKRKDKDGQQVETTEWHRLVFFGKLAEIVRDYLKKGSKLVVQGSIRYSKWEKDGVTHYGTDIVCDSMKMLDGKPADGGQQRPASQQARHAPKPAPQDAPMDDFTDDDIPF